MANPTRTEYMLGANRLRDMASSAKQLAPAAQGAVSIRAVAVKAGDVDRRIPNAEGSAGEGA